MSIDPDAAATLAKRLRFQSRGCAELGSPLYAGLLARAAEDVEAGGPAWELLRGHEGDPGPSALALRLMGSVHRLVLEGAAPRLAELYADPARDERETWGALAAVLESSRARLAPLIDRGVQTNEVGRCAALLPGFCAVASSTGLPLRLLELGSSAGLNLRFDGYRYDAEGLSWGPPGSPVQLSPSVSGSVRLGGVEIAERRGCDVAPLDPASAGDRLTLLSYLWPDQPGRIERLRAALGLAAATEATVERGGAARWLGERLAAPVPGVASVVFHSIFIQYPSAEERRQIVEAIAGAGERASSGAPLAWLRMEPAGEMCEVRLTLWPGAQEHLLARAGYHGDPIELL